MRLLFILSILTIACSASGQTNQNSISQVRYDGFYQTVSDISKEDNDTSYSYLRFYPDGRVISITSEGTAFDLQEWFNLEMHDISVGKYQIREKRLYFSTTNTSGTVIYRGKISDQYHLSLRAKSLINGYKDRGKYYFIEISDLK